MSHDHLLLGVATQRMHERERAAERHRLVGGKRLRALSGWVRLDWRVVRGHRELVAGFGVSWRRAPG
ncbi:hypothetical protein [Saccharothrix syringae]|uniref:Uncharacterized protein n=1 Tax=Saccharothrix syringae TaxID=103733 RepID=A0A5Q0GUN7_SACSY|nr:hypothetical protein [Saccharothrix syringae]QFZ17214.1 hypothetical protein EKG83_06810 [Saccharothrix syringae]